MNPLQRIVDLVFPNRRHERSITVRYAFPFMLALTTFLGAAALMGEKDTYIIVESRQEQIAAGDNFEIDVFVVAKVPVNAVDIKLAIPKGQVKFLGVDTGESVITLWTKDPYFENGTVHMTGGTYRKGFIGKHRIATVSVQALTSGLAQIGVSHADLYAGDGTGAKVTVAEAGEDSTELVIAREDGTYVPSAVVGGEVGFSIIGDVDGDGKVTLKDISSFMAAWHNKSTLYDFNGDSKMTFRDFGIILAKYFFQ